MQLTERKRRRAARAKRRQNAANAINHEQLISAVLAQGRESVRQLNAMLEILAGYADFQRKGKRNV